MKRCSSCRIEKAADCFYRYSRSADGLQPYCKQCVAAYRATNRARFASYNAKQRNKDVEKTREYKRQHWAKNRDAELARNAAYRELNREKIRARVSQYQSRNLEKWRSYNAAYAAKKLMATPPWADEKKMMEFYFAADFLSMVTGDWYHVDHIVPLRSKVVCGLHCEANLQVLSGAENQAKSNRYWPDMP